MSFIRLSPDTLIRMCERTVAKAQAEREANAKAWDALPWYSGIWDLISMLIGISYERPYMPLGGLSGRELLCQDLVRAALLVRGQPDSTVRVDLDDLAYLEDPA